MHIQVKMGTKKISTYTKSGKMPSFLNVKVWSAYLQLPFFSSLQTRSTRVPVTADGSHATAGNNFE